MLALDAFSVRDGTRIDAARQHSYQVARHRPMSIPAFAGCCLNFL
jgi:hypothetical protein